ncbi:hypothetical protein NPIL_117001 [Nephila pilipes]|uniref:Uncharacterized protein n=1 Tax=Nephila pilipes TaxID=299642 RepID=A0A8X6MI97_NEPPI|nr:hypothetical protein NPIL_117001 [Nephila pilipes]
MYYERSTSNTILVAKRYKNFEIGNEVIVLVPDSAHKMYAIWTSPCTIVGKRNIHCYLVQMPDSRKRNLFAKAKASAPVVPIQQEEAAITCFPGRTKDSGHVCVDKESLCPSPQSCRGF